MPEISEKPWCYPERGGKVKKLAIIPAYNEEACVENTVREVMRTAPDFDYIVVNDCSTDSTERILRENGFNFISLPVNLGIGGAVQAGYRYALKKNYDMAVQVDADGQHDPRYLEPMCEAMEKSGADMVIGSRFIEKEGYQSTRLRRIGINYFTSLIKQMTGVVITDPTSGLRLSNRRIIREFAEWYPKDFPEPESIVTLLRRGYKVVEVPVRMRERQGGKSSINTKASFYYMIKVTMAILFARFRTRREEEK